MCGVHLERGGVELLELSEVPAARGFEMKLRVRTVVPPGGGAQMNIVPTPHNPFEVNLDHLTRLNPMERTLRSVRLPAPTPPHLSATTDVPRGHNHRFTGELMPPRARNCTPQGKTLPSSSHAP